MADIRARYGLIEAGGTKFVLGVAEGPSAELAENPAGRVIARHQIATTTPDATLAAAIAWLHEQAGGAGLAGIGIAAFGPLCLDRAAAQWGHIVRTTKPGWSGTDLVGTFARAFACPVAIDTDVNAAALAEARWGTGRQRRQRHQHGRGALLYLTIGTGIGGGFVAADGTLLHGLSHPEMGHIRMPRHPADVGADGRPFPGVCRYHGDCLEGLASGPAVIARWGASLSDLGPGHPGAGIIAWYLGQMVCTFQAVLEPAHIVLGGGVMGTPGLIDTVRQAATTASAGYFAADPATLVTLPALWPDSGLLGALALILPGPGQNAEGPQPC